MKKIMAVASSLVLAVSLCACGGSSAPKETTQAAAESTAVESKAAESTAAESKEAEKPAAESAAAESTAAEAAADYTEITMKFATSSAETTLTAKTFMNWGDRLSEASGGKVKVDVYCSSVLGNNAETIQGAQVGTIDFATIQPGGLADMGATKMNLLTLPYLFESYDQYYDALFGPIGEELLQDVTDHVPGLIGFGYLPDGGRCYFTKGKPITKLEDIKGMKLRLQSFAIDSDTAEVLGCSSTPIVFSELYSALQTGVVDGAENCMVAIDGNALYEVTDYLTLDNHIYNIPIVTMSQKTWDSLNEDTQKLLKAAWRETIEEYFRPQLAKEEESLKEKFKGSGMEIYELSDPEKWVEAMKPIWEKYGAGIEDLIAEVQALKK